jgi:hypothetical protein
MISFFGQYSRMNTLEVLALGLKKLAHPMSLVRQRNCPELQPLMPLMEPQRRLKRMREGAGCWKT